MGNLKDLDSVTLNGSPVMVSSLARKIGFMFLHTQWLTIFFVTRQVFRFAADYSAEKLTSHEDSKST